MPSRLKKSIAATIAALALLVGSIAHGADAATSPSCKRRSYLVMDLAGQPRITVQRTLNNMARNPDPYVLVGFDNDRYVMVQVRPCA